MEEVYYKPFHETYKSIAFAMAIGLIYPNPTKRRGRYILVALLLFSFVPFTTIALYNVYMSVRAGDIGETLAHNTILGPLVGGLFKTCLLNFYEEKCKYLIDEMDRDLASCAGPRRRAAAAACVRDTKRVAAFWTAYIVCSVAIFPASAAALTAHSRFNFEPEMYLVHDLRLPFLEPGARFATPYYEWMFAYGIYSSVSFVVNYLGYDVFFAACVNHACLKTELYCAAMEEAVEAETDGEMYERVGDVVKSQLRMYKFADTIQDVFNTWIGTMLVAATIQMGSCLYHVADSHEFDYKYIVYTVAVVIYVYQPCWYSSKLRDMCSASATRLYGCGWERRRGARLRGALAFAIARAQRPKEVVAFGVFAFNMELFVSIIQTSYSFYTLMRQ